MPQFIFVTYLCHFQNTLDR